MHEHAFPMRWADLDQLNHVNNVVYLDYAAEARALLVEDGVVAADAGIVGQSVRFLRPLLLSRTPVTVRSTVDEGVLDQAITAGDAARTFATVSTRYGVAEQASARDGVPTLPVRIRRSDLGPDLTVRPTKIFELFQETRVLSISTHLGSMTPGSFVVGSSDVTLRAPVTWRPEPYVVTVWVSRVGTASFEVRCQLVDGPTVLADSTTGLVGFDKSTQTSRPFGDDERADLRGLLHP